MWKRKLEAEEVEAVKNSQTPVGGGCGSGSGSGGSGNKFIASLWRLFSSILWITMMDGRKHERTFKAMSWRKNE